MKELVKDVLPLVIGLSIFLALSIYGCSSEQNGKQTKEQNRIKTLATECVNICPRGVDSFESSYGNSVCKCRN